MTATLTITKGSTTLDLLTSPYQYSGEPDLGGVQHEFEYGYGADIDLPRFGATSTSGPREVPFTILVTGTTADTLAAYVSALIAVLPDDDTPSTITVGGNGSSYTGTLTARRVVGAVRKPWSHMETQKYKTLVSFTLACEPFVSGATETIYDPVADLADRTNYCDYGDFESWVASPGQLADGWSHSTSTTASLPTPTQVTGRSGGYAQRLQYTSSSDTNKASKLNHQTPVGSVDGAEDLTLSFSVKGTATGCTPTVFLYDQLYNLIATATYTVTASWQTVTISGTANAASTRVWVMHHVTGIDTGDSFDITYDDVFLDKPDELSPSSFLVPAVVPLGTIKGDLPALLGIKAQAPLADFRCFWAGVYPDASAVVGDFVHTMADKTWSAGSATTDSDGYPAGTGNTVWSDGSDALVTTSIDTSNLLAGEYLVLARCKTATVHGDVFCGTSTTESLMSTAHVESTTLEWYPLGVYTLPTLAVRSTDSAPLYIGIKSIATGTMYINCVALIPITWSGLIGWRNLSSHCHTLVWDDDAVVYADDIGSLGYSYGGRQLTAKTGVIVVVAGPSSSPDPTLRVDLTVLYVPRWEQMPT